MRAGKPEPPRFAAPAQKPFGSYVPSVSARIRKPVTDQAQPPPPPHAAFRLSGSWCMELPLIPTTLAPGSYNRFARVFAEAYGS
jgi:hypothetical protein